MSPGAGGPGVLDEHGVLAPGTSTAVTLVCSPVDQTQPLPALHDTLQFYSGQGTLQLRRARVHVHRQAPT